MIFKRSSNVLVFISISFSEPFQLIATLSSFNFIEYFPFIISLFHWESFLFCLSSLFFSHTHLSNLKYFISYIFYLFHFHSFRLELMINLSWRTILILYFSWWYFKICNLGYERVLWRFWVLKEWHQWFSK